LLGAFFDSCELRAPVAFESAGPLVKWSEVLCVGAIEHLTAVTSHVYQADVAENPEVFGHRRLREAQRPDDVADGTLAGREIVQDLSPTRFGDGVEGVGGRGGARHSRIIYPYGNMSSGSAPRTFSCQPAGYAVVDGSV